MNKILITVTLLICFLSYLVFDTFFQSSESEVGHSFSFTESPEKRDQLVSDLKKINSFEKSEKSPTDELAKDDLINVVDEIISNGISSVDLNQLESLKNEAKKVPIIFHDHLELKWSSGYSQNNKTMMKNIFLLASVLSIKFPIIQKDAEEILLAMSAGEIDWDKSVFESGLQFYLIQNKFNDNASIEFLNQLKENAKNKNELKNLVNSVINTINI